MRRLLIGICLLLSAGTVQAAVNVVATTTNMGMLAETVGGEHVRVRVLAPPDRDPHYLSVRPNMMAALRRADLVVAVGAELEIGWLPPALQGAHNPRVQPGERGYFEAAAHVDLIDAHGVADRSLGDVHPGGNPHLYLDPVRMAEVAEALAERLAALDRANAEAFRANAAAFAEQVRERMPQWQQRAQAAEGVVLYHKDANYLTERFDVPVLGYIEPIPGVPPTASHLRRLVEQLEGEQAVIVHTIYQPEQGPRFVARELGLPVSRLRNAIPEGAGADGYFAMIDDWVAALVPDSR